MLKFGIILVLALIDSTPIFNVKIFGATDNVFLVKMYKLTILQYFTTYGTDRLDIFYLTFQGSPLLIFGDYLGIKTWNAIRAVNLTHLVAVNVMSIDNLV